MKKLHEYYKELEKECLSCKTKFNVWVAEANFETEQEEGVKSHFHQYCPACKTLEKGGKINLS